uniref:Ig-like domain-containing protein n=1 Tax=Sus scrofa TaxID=9823 RepID=A0A8D1QBE8_PIG
TRQRDGEKEGTVLPKAEVKLQPAWINVLQEDSVTLTCQGDHDPGNTTTQWFHNGNFTWTENQPSFSFKARRASSGYYRCQTAYSSLSDPVHLDVISATVSSSAQWRDYCLLYQVLVRISISLPHPQPRLSVQLEVKVVF